MLKKNAWSILSAVLAVIFMFTFSTFAQDQTKTKTTDPTKTTEQTTTTVQKDPKIDASAKELTDNLAAKVTLRDEQKTDIQDAIYEYQASAVGVSAPPSKTGTDQTSTDQSKTSTDESKTSTGMTDKKSTDMSQNKKDDQWLNSEIENILDTSQKSQWQVAKADFWNQLRDKVSTLKSDKSKSMY